jgi:glyoxylase-like metal-dependent hydrolase (beta-lactamase superfamily II)
VHVRRRSRRSVGGPNNSWAWPGSLQDVVHTFDVHHLGRDRVIAAHMVRDLIIDPGPTSSLDNWIGELAGEPRALLLTHVHLDHAGAAGALVRRFPDLLVYVSELGAPHLVDPSKLLRSAGRLYGEQNMDRLWGEVVPVPERNVVALAGGEEVQGFRVEHVPGHASHHLCWLDLIHGDAYVGDMAGVRIPPGHFTIVPTPPPEIDVEAWLDSIDRIEALAPERLRLTHFGVAGDVGAQLQRAREMLGREAELARGGDRDAFLSALEAEIDAGADPSASASLRQAIPADQAWEGLERYWRKRAERQTGAARSG